MPKPMTPSEFLVAASVAPEVFELRPDYRAMLVVIEGLTPAITTQAGDGTVATVIAEAETHATELLADTPVDELPHIAA